MAQEVENRQGGKKNTSVDWRSDGGGRGNGIKQATPQRFVSGRCKEKLGVK
jgi:hypothetical protein